MFRMRFACALVFAYSSSCSSICSSSAFAAVESETVTQGVAAFGQAEFEHCVELLQRALGESLTREEKVLSFRTLGFCQSALGHDAEAREAFVQLLRVDDQAELDKSVAPKVRALFEEARASYATGKIESVEAPVLPSLHPDVGKGKEGQPISVSVSYPGGAAQTMQIFYRSRGQLRFETEKAAVGSDGTASLRVPGRAVHPPAVELYLTALDAHGVAIARAGSFSEPLIVGVAAPVAKVPVYKRGWFWGVIGGLVVAGAAVGLGVGLGRPSGNADLTIVSK
jgi:hypothetical protein